MNRRSLFGAIALSPFIAAQVVAKEYSSAEDAPPEKGCNLTLMGTKNRKDSSLMYLSEGAPSQFISVDMPQSDPDRAVTLSVGNDGRLWIKSVGGKWQRVVTE